MTPLGYQSLRLQVTSYTVGCRYNAVNFHPNPKKYTVQLAREGEVWGVCCEFNLWLSSVLVAAVLYAIYCFIGPRYSDTRQYL